MNAEIIAVGSELLLGQIANTNAQFISKELAEVGINVYFHTVVGDNPQRLKHVIETAEQRADVLLFTGGLGPTKDDLTKETVARHLGVQLVHDPEALHYIEDYFASVNRQMTPNNRKQALVLEGCEVLKNTTGMAPGMALTKQGKVYLMFPGPPHELQPMFLKSALPYLTNTFPELDRIESRVLRFTGIGESQLEHELEDLLSAQTNPTIAPLAKPGEVTLRLTVKHRDPQEAKRLLDACEEKIKARVGEYLYGYGETMLPEALVHTLKEKQQTVAAAESLTGGMFADALIAVPGASSVVKGGVVCYHPDLKVSLLSIQPDVIKTYGTVSEECAKAMAENIRRIAGASIGIGFTGVAGPDDLEGKAPGTVYIAVATENGTTVDSFRFAGSRASVRNRAVRQGMALLLRGE
ncbi:competence/damage-inducible protein A [Aureibacillus halotolerans]|uniref:Putative competence-damage inducible protein n=1 Tax=Aureibacillus halotolerans TaxID=1508390 RepID=A0A4R6U2W4_9BACI|nr:competence/damage-inducible protein A [Aureibacillus halotolerans]TDQ39712.1 nicotinamide-nucleotide amidase [Aureibacillus halotolerans]